MRSVARLVLPACLFSGFPAIAGEIEQFYLSCDAGRGVTQHWDYDGQDFRFYTRSRSGVNEIEVRRAPDVYKSTSENHGIKLETIYIRSAWLTQNNTYDLVTYEIISMVENNHPLHRHGRPAIPWKEVSILKYGAYVSKDGYLDSAYTDRSSRDNCKLSPKQYTP